MTTLNEFITFEHDLEHVLEHNVTEKRKFSDPKIYDANGDLTKRWYVYFSFRDPETGKLKRMKNIYGKASNYNTKAARLTVLTKYRQSLLRFLKKGYDPHKDNTALFQKHQNKLASKPSYSQPAKFVIAHTKTEREQKPEQKRPKKGPKSEDN